MQKQRKFNDFIENAQPITREKYVLSYIKLSWKNVNFQFNNIIINFNNWWYNFSCKTFSKFITFNNNINKFEIIFKTYYFKNVRSKLIFIVHLTLFSKISVCFMLLSFFQTTRLFEEGTSVIFNVHLVCI